MPYVLCRFVIGSKATLKITEHLYKDIRDAKAGLGEIIAVEEKFDTLMENYVELESTLLTLGARHLAFVDSDLKDLLVPRNLISRRVLNLLASARLYRDALMQHVSHILGSKNPEVKRFEDSLRDTTTQPMTYRMAEAIRNYTQHQELPISGITFHRKREGDITVSAAGFAFWIKPVLDGVEVSKRRDIAADVRASLEALGSDANPMPLLREYVQHIGAFHHAFRDLVNPKEVAWEQVITSNIARFARRFPQEGVIGLAAGLQHKNRTVTEPEYLVQDRLDYRAFLKTKNLASVNLSRRYVKWSE